jgi:serine/threonine protein kinase
MDYIPGGNLRELIKRFKYLPEVKQIRLFSMFFIFYFNVLFCFSRTGQFYASEVLAISHLHSLNVLYRDIKPHNVMIERKGHLILIDFGLSKQEITHPRGALSLVGTPDYSAPEVLRTGVQQIEAHNREKALRAKQGKKYKANATNNQNNTTNHPAGGDGNNANNNNIAVGTNHRLRESR